MKKHLFLKLKRDKQKRTWELIEGVTLFNYESDSYVQVKAKNHAQAKRMLAAAWINKIKKEARELTIRDLMQEIEPSDVQSLCVDCGEEYGTYGDSPYCDTCLKLQEECKNGTCDCEQAFKDIQDEKKEKYLKRG